MTSRQLLLCSFVIYQVAFVIFLPPSAQKSINAALELKKPMELLCDSVKRNFNIVLLQRFVESVYKISRNCLQCSTEYEHILDLVQVQVNK